MKARKKQEKRRIPQSAGDEVHEFKGMIRNLAQTVNEAFTGDKTEIRDLKTKIENNKNKVMWRKTKIKEVDSQWK